MFPNKSTKTIIICTLLCLATLLDPTDARKTSSSSSRRNGGVSSGRVTKPQGYANPGIASLSYGPGQAAIPRPQPSAPKHADPSIAQLSYGNNQPAISKQTAPVQHAAPPQAPSAPVMPPQAPVAPSQGARPIGWNVDQQANKPQVNSAPYPQQNSAPYPQQNSAPYPLQNSAPYPVQNPQHNSAPYPVQNPPPYSQYPHAGGQPNYPAGYPQSPPQQYPVQQGGFHPGQPQITNNYYGGAPGGGGSSGSGLQTALIAGVGGLALYGALKPSETKTIIINNTAIVVPENATVPAGATVLPANSTLPPGVALAPLQVATEQPVLLAAYPGMENGTTQIIPQTTPASSSEVPISGSTDGGSTTESVLLAGYPSTGLYPSLPVTMTTGVPLASYPGSEPTPKPVALASLEDSTHKTGKSGATSIQVAVMLFLPLLRVFL